MSSSVNVFPLNKVHKESIHLLTSSELSLSGQGSVACYFHVFVPYVTLIQWKLTPTFAVFAFYHFQNSSNQKVCEKQKKRDVTTRMKKCTLKNKMRHHAFKPWCPILFISVWIFLRGISPGFPLFIDTQRMLYLWMDEKHQSRFIFVKTSPDKVVRFPYNKRRHHTLGFETLQDSKVRL